MNKELKNIPKLRFPEFEGEWEKRNVKNVFSIFNGYAFPSSASVNNGALWVKIADVGIQKMKTNNLSYLPNSFIKSHSKFLLKKNDYVIALTRPILSGELKIARINDFFNNSLLNQRVGKLVSDEILDYIYYLLQNTRLIKSIENNIAGSDPPNLSPKEINNIKVYVPQKPEQTKIANFLTAVDKRINLLQKKKAELEQYKKGIMQKLFSQSLRFKDDKGNDFPDWEVKKLGEVLNYLQPTKYLVSDTEYKDEYDIPVLTAGKTFLLGYSNETEGVFKEKLPTIIFDDFTTAFQFVDFPFKAKSSAMKMLIPINKDVNIKYVFEVMKTIKFPLAEHKRYWISEYQNEKIPYPQKEEQQKIANFLSSIDKRITNEELQIKKMQNWKKGLLQKMFV